MQCYPRQHDVMFETKTSVDFNADGSIFRVDIFAIETVSHRECTLYIRYIYEGQSVTCMKKSMPMGMRPPFFPFFRSFSLSRLFCFPTQILFFAGCFFTHTLHILFPNPFLCHHITIFQHQTDIPALETTKKTFAKWHTS